MIWERRAASIRGDFSETIGPTRVPLVSGPSKAHRRVAAEARRVRHVLRLQTALSWPGLAIVPSRRRGGRGQPVHTRSGLGCHLAWARCPVEATSSMLLGK